MDRRGLLKVVGALALAALMGVGATAAEKSKTTGACTCCGDACKCPACTCDAKAGTARGCACCGGAACCPATAGKAAKAADARIRSCCEKDAEAAKVARAGKPACACCGDDCTCPACTCIAIARAGSSKAGTDCDRCGDACCTPSGGV